MTKLGDSLVPLLSPHYPADEITRLFLPETYPTPLLPVPPPPTTDPLFLPDFTLIDPPLLAGPASSSFPVKPPRSRKPQDLVVLPDSPPPGSLAAELIADAAHKATDKEREAARLDEFIKNNTDPTGRGRHASAKEKKAAQASNGNFSCYSPVPIRSSPPPSSC